MDPPDLKAIAPAESPLPFRLRKKIFVLEDVLSRA